MLALAAGEMNVVGDTESTLTGRARITLAYALREYPESYQLLLGT